MSPIFVHIQQMKYMYEILLSHAIYMLIVIFTLFHDSCFLNQPTISLKKKKNSKNRLVLLYWISMMMIKPASMQKTHLSVYRKLQNHQHRTTEQTPVFIRSGLKCHKVVLFHSTTWARKVSDESQHFCMGFPGHLKPLRWAHHWHSLALQFALPAWHQLFGTLTNSKNSQEHLVQGGSCKR